MVQEDAVPSVDVLDGPLDEVEIIPLGGAQEVGRSCIYLRWRGRSLLLDCGLHPAFKGRHSLPYLEEVDLESVEAVLVTHFHHDHCAALPYLVGQTNFKGRVLMTHPTRAVLGTLLRDTVRLDMSSGEEPLYTEADVEEAMRRTEVISFRQTKDLGGIAITALAAGHVLGAAMYLIEWDGLRVLYTGDYSRVPDRHLSAADLPTTPPHIVIVEATCGIAQHESRAEREAKLTNAVARIVSNGGRVLIPCVAIGRAQEILLVLEEFWERNPAFQNVPIYQASGQAQRAQNVYQAYVEMMNDSIRESFARVANPFHFKHVQVLASGSQFDDVGPCVVLAAPAMLQSGFSRQLLEMWCGDPANGVVLADFHVQGTLARELTAHPEEIPSLQGYKLPMRAQVESVSFWAHADWPQTREFLQQLSPEHIMLVHGEEHEMMRLRKALEGDAATRGLRREVHTPANCEAVHIPHRPSRRARMLGSLAVQPWADGAGVSGLVVRPKGSRLDLIIDPKDLPAFTRLTTGAVRQKQIMAIHRPFSEVRLALEAMFEGLESAEVRDGVSGVLPETKAEVAGDGKTEDGDGDGPELAGLRKGEDGEKGKGAGGGSEAGAGAAGARGAGQAGLPGDRGEVLLVGDDLVLRYTPARRSGGAGSLVMEWEGGAAGDMLADAVVATVMMVEGPPVSMGTAEADRRMCLLKGDREGATRAEAGMVAGLLEAQFGSVSEGESVTTLMLDCGGDCTLRVDLTDRSVEVEDAEPTPAAERLAARVQLALARIYEAIDPVPIK